VCKVFFLSHFLTVCGNENKMENRKIGDNKGHAANNVIVGYDMTLCNTTNCPVFRSNILLPSSGYKNKIPEDGGGAFLRSFVNFVLHRTAACICHRGNETSQPITH
jgi:hypothetical protein